MRNLVASAVAVAVAVAVAAPMLPAAAHHDDPQCTLTVHHPLGTDEFPLPNTGFLPIDDVPTDIGSLKVFINCQHGGGNGGGRGGGNGDGRG